MYQIEIKVKSYDGWNIFVECSDEKLIDITIDNLKRNPIVLAIRKIEWTEPKFTDWNRK